MDGVEKRIQAYLKKVGEINKVNLEKVELAIEPQNVLKDIAKGNQRAKELKKQAIQLMGKIANVMVDAKQFVNETSTLRDGSGIYNVAYYETAINDIEKAAKNLGVNPKEVKMYRDLKAAQSENIELVKDAVKFIADVREMTKR